LVSVAAGPICLALPDTARALITNEALIMVKEGEAAHERIRRAADEVESCFSCLNVDATPL
jgi:hypothetical protein